MIKFTVFTILSTFLVESFAACPDRGIRPVPSLDMQRINGTWYEIERMKNTLDNGNCRTFFFNPINNTSSRLNITVNNGGGTNIEYTGVVTNPNGNGEMTFFPAFENMKVFLTITVNYIDDMIVYDCTNGVDDTAREFLWYLSRTPLSSATGRATADAIYDQYRFNRTNFFDDNQDPEFCNRS